jgi:hypothetical protein
MAKYLCGWHIWRHGVENVLGLCLGCKEGELSVGRVDMYDMYDMNWRGAFFSNNGNSASALD